MAELKAVYHEEFLRGFGEKVRAVYGAFDVDGFVAAVLEAPWETLELKARMRRITERLGQFLPSRYEEALAVLFAVEEGCTGLPYLFFPDFVEVYGQAEEDWELSMQALARFTKLSTAEFAVRPFLLREPERMMAQMTIWAQDENEHLRRLASEGCRPRLPWGQALPMFKRDPAPVLQLLELLKADPSLYVRKSVANNLNDIAKDHPQLVIETARRWLGVHPLTDWIVRRGCRTLVRQADPEVMQLFGYADTAEGDALVTQASLSAAPATVRIGENCELQYALQIREGEQVKIRVEYGIDFVKKRGVSRKLFLLSDKTVPGGATLSGVRTHKWADLSTRRHYPGEHRIVLLVNGQEAAAAAVMLES
ncbi:hypothetical protein CBW65_06405 [Tumebacillus avium]|uniref:DNA alkylation repair protein n=1 Tax=Tumebacillus avium TaxID=1903704 RepID=A0A1Y0IJS2_9BACL|nr:DNA alkylation repair protein [Tumebacillus avium]ARU60762.1 hypothetical protein CBW65_06405 [Tumebacillus avium]